MCMRVPVCLCCVYSGRRGRQPTPHKPPHQPKTLYSWRDVLSASLRRHSRHASSLGSADPALLAGLLDEERAATNKGATGGPRRGPEGAAVAAAAGEANAQFAGGAGGDDAGEGAREGEGVRVGSPAGTYVE